MKVFPNLTALFISFFQSSPAFAQQQDPMQLNGGSMMAMAGENCVAIAVDKRFGSGPQMVNVSPRTVLIPHSKVLIGLVGLEGDVQSLSQDLSIQISSKMGGHMGFGFRDTSKGREISPKSASTLLSHMLYKRRSSPYYVEPIIAGLERVLLDNKNKMEMDSSLSENVSGIETGRIKKDSLHVKYKPFLCTQDFIGAQSKSRSFVCSGAASKSLYGTAEAMWRPGLKPEELVQVLGRAFLSALERDCLSGYGAVCYLIEGGKGVEEIDLSSRND